MPFRSLESDNFKKIMQDHILNTIEYLFNEHQEFGVACEIKYVKFNPELPHDIQNALPEITLFMLANYSFESASIDDQFLSFEAGFGHQNIGAVVHIPLLSIKQLFVGEYPVLINITSPKREKKQEKIKEIDSMSALLNNPENAKLLKKKKS